MTTAPSEISTYVLRPIDPAVTDELRRSATVVRVADEHPGFPCRQCLRDAEVGERLVLVSHDPFGVDSPYRSPSPIFLHAEPCTPPDDLHALPAQLTRRRLSVRAFDIAAMMLDAEVVDGSDLDEVLTRLLAAERVDHVQVHNAAPGCWAVRVDRA